MDNSDTEIWDKLLAFYKHPKLDTFKCNISIDLTNRPAVDIGGVQRQIFSTVVKQFISNQHIHLFSGPVECLRPHYSTAVRCSGLFEVLGSIVGHIFPKTELASCTSARRASTIFLLERIKH